MNKKLMRLLVGVVFALNVSSSGAALIFEDLVTLEVPDLANEVELLVSRLPGENVNITYEFGEIDLSLFGDIYNTMFNLREQAVEVTAEAEVIAETLAELQLFAEVLENRRSDLNALLQEISDQTASDFTDFLSAFTTSNELIRIPVIYEPSLGPQNSDFVALPVLNSFLQDRGLLFRFDLPGQSVPEPGTIALVVIGLIVLFASKRNKTQEEEKTRVRE